MDQDFGSLALGDGSSGGFGRSLRGVSRGETGVTLAPHAPSLVSWNDMLVLTHSETFLSRRSAVALGPLVVEPELLCFLGQLLEHLTSFPVLSRLVAQ